MREDNYSNVCCRQSVKNLRTIHTLYGGRNLILWRPKGSQMWRESISLTEALCLFWVPPWGLHLSPVTKIHIIDRVLYCRMALLSPIIENWLWKWYRGIEKKKLFKLILYFSGIFHLFCAFVLQHVWNVWKYLCGNHDYAKSKKEADFVLNEAKHVNEQMNELINESIKVCEN